MKKGDLVLVWGKRVGLIRRTEGTGSLVWTSGKRTESASTVYPSGRTLVELVGGTDPPGGYSAWWPTADLEPLPPGWQLELDWGA